MVADRELSGLRATGSHDGEPVAPTHVYSYNTKDGSYVYSTYRDPGATPSSGTVTINGNLWTYSGSFEANGKKTEFRTTNDFSKPGAEIFKTETSDDGGAHWKTVLEGSAKKVGD